MSYPAELSFGYEICPFVFPLQFGWWDDGHSTAFDGQPVPSGLFLKTFLTSRCTVEVGAYRPAIHLCLQPPSPTTTKGLRLMGTGWTPDRVIRRSGPALAHASKWSTPSNPLPGVAWCEDGTRMTHHRPPNALTPLQEHPPRPDRYQTYLCQYIWKHLLLVGILGHGLDSIPHPEQYARLSHAATLIHASALQVVASYSPSGDGPCATKM